MSLDDPLLENGIEVPAGVSRAHEPSEEPHAKHHEQGKREQIKDAVDDAGHPSPPEDEVKRGNKNSEHPHPK